MNENQYDQDGTAWIHNNFITLSDHMATNKPILPTQTEQCFRRYEEAIGIIVNRWPQLTSFKSESVAPTTYIARLRDAIASLSKHGWDSSVVNKSIFYSVADHIVCALRDNTIYAGPAQAIRTLSNPPENTPVFVRADSDASCFVINHLETLECLASLAANRQLAGPITITPAKPEWLQALESRYDIVVEPLDNNQWRIL